MTRVIISIMDNNSYNHNRSYTDISIAPSLVGSNPTQVMLCVMHKFVPSLGVLCAHLMSPQKRMYIPNA